MNSELRLSGLRILLVGSGSIALRHAHVLKSLGVGEIHVFSRSRRELRVEGVDLVAVDERELLQVRFDLTVICSRTQDHLLDLVLLSQNSDLILIEKPLSGSLEHLEKMASEQAFLTQTYVSFPLRFTEGFATYRDWIIKSARKGAEITAVCQSWLPDWRPGREVHDGYWAQPGSGGVLLELVHEFDYLGFLLGSLEIVDISDLSRNVLGLAVPESISARALGPAGERVTINLDFSVSESSRYSSYTNDNVFGRWDLLENTLETVTDGRRTVTSFASDFDRNQLFRKQYEELFSPGTHPVSVCNFDSALELNQAILRAWAGH